MSYYDNQESVANIYVGLTQRGWNCYGYRADESDSMTDYWSPARWDGIAEKNGFVLLVDVYSTSISGHKVEKSTYTPDYAKISKLQATIDDKAASQNEKEMSQKIIDKMLNKQKESTVITEQYPTFSHANPKGCNWHIEKDGVIIAKGKGAFQCDGYLFGGYEVETMKKVNAFIDKVESKIAGSEQLQAIQKKVIKKVIKPVEVTDRKTLQIGDILSFEYHGHFWKVYSLSEKTFSYQLLGSEKRGYKETKNGKRYYDYMKKFNENLENGKIKIYELKEVEEVTYKTVYKAVKRSAQEENLLQGEVTEEATTNQKTAPEASQTEVNNSDSLKVELIPNEEKNGIELKFNGKPSEETRALLKENGFRWGAFNKVWYTKKSDKSVLFAEAFVSAFNDTDITEEETTTQENTYNSEDITEPTNNNFVFDDSYNSNVELDLQYFGVAPATDDILNMFDDIDLTNTDNSLITSEDRQQCELYENEYNSFKAIYEPILSKLEALKGNNRYIDQYSDIRPITERLEKAKNNFLNDVLNHFKEKYSITINYWELEKKYKDKPLTLDTILEEVILLLDGLTFNELEAQQITAAMKGNVEHKKTVIKNNKISIPSFFWVSSENYTGKTNFKLDYRQFEKVTTLFKAIAHFNNESYSKFNELERTIKHEYNEDVFKVHDLQLSKVESIKLYKNGKLDIVFSSSQHAKDFNSQYLQK